MLRRALFYIVIGLSLTTISCKDSKKSNSDSKKNAPQAPIAQPLPEIPHSDNPGNGEVDKENPDLTEGETEYVHVSRKFCLKVIYGKYVPSILCHDFDPYKEYTAYRWCSAEKSYQYATTGYSTYSANQVQFYNRGYQPAGNSGYNTQCQGGYPYFIQYHYGIKKIYFASLLNYTSFRSYYK